ncbi:ATP-grasp domain-containing protein [bacterium]|nr:ATP-grasp domain-containing protein [bacterium]
MKIAVAYSSKKGLIQEYRKRKQIQKIPGDEYFAEGDSIKTIQAVIETLLKMGHQAVGIEADNNAFQKLSAEEPDLVLNISEGLTGDFRESYIPMLCERLNLPYTGSDPLTLGLCLNKMRTKEILGFYQIPTPAFQVFYSDNAMATEHLIYPVIVKPIAEGSSKGINNRSVVNDPTAAKSVIAEKLLKYEQPVIVESFLTGAEFTVALWGNGEEVEALPIVEICFEELPEGAWPMYSYEAKWVWDSPDKPLQIFQCPAKIDAKLNQEIVSVAKRAYYILGIRDWCRIDIRLDQEGVPNILELNPLPGILPDPKENSCFPKSARTAGYSYSDMIGRLISIACRRVGLIENINAPVYRS